MPLREAYLDVVDAGTFVPSDAVAARGDTRALLAIGSVWLGQTRLIDNVAFTVAPQPVASATVGVG
jgi:pantothenate synthetase